MAGQQNNGGSPDSPQHVNQVPHRTSWPNLFKEDMSVLATSPEHCFSDHRARSVWTVVLSILGTATGSSVTGVLEFTTDGTIFQPMGAAITANATTPVVVQNITGFAACRFRFRTTGTVTLGSSTGYRVGLAAAGS